MIPFNKPVWLGTEVDRITEAIQLHGHVAGGGPFGQYCERWLSEMFAQPTVVVTSGTHGLELAALLLDLKPGDEVIVPSYTFVSTANAFVLRGARPVFADVDAGGNLDAREVARLRTPRTRAVALVHYAGNSCNMERMAAACDGVALVEDAAQALGSRFDGKPLGTFGVCGAISFHETKNLGCGEGGALTVRDAAQFERAVVLRDKGTNRRRFLAGLVDKYTWIDVGSSYALSDLNAAYLSAQLDAFDRIQETRRRLFDRYAAELAPAIVEKGGYVILPRARCDSNRHLFAVVWRNQDVRDQFIAHMRHHGIITPFHYVALHQSPFGQHFHDGRSLPMSERLTTCLVRLPLFFNMSEHEQDEVMMRTQEFLHVI